MEAQIRKVVEEALNALAKASREERSPDASSDDAFRGASGVVFAVERPSDMNHGDYAVNAALPAAKQLGKKPHEVAGVISASLQGALGNTVSKIEVAGPGFVNITLSPACIREAVANAPVIESELAGKRVMIEYTDPNPFKEMHIGHLMSNTIGESISRLIQNAGATVARANYQGDVGPHVAKAIWGLQKSGITEPETAAQLGKAYAEGSAAYDTDETAKAEIDSLNKEIYTGENQEVMELWRKGRDISLEAFENLYTVLGTKFDYYFFESETAEPGMELVRDGLARGVFDESEGAVIYKGEKKGLHTLVFVTSKGNPTYEAKDLGLAYLKEERWPSYLSIVLTANEQIGHFKVMFAALEDIAPLLAAKTTHIPHGFLRLTTGKMSSREGNVVTALSLIHETFAKALERNPDPLIAGQVSIAAIKYSILKQGAGGDIIFDMEKALSLEGDSGPYLQYALVRAKKILAYEGNGTSGNEVPPEPYAIERILIHFPEAVRRATAERAPHHVTQFLTELAGAWNSFYAKEQILGSPEEEYKIRVAHAFARTMSTGLGLLGIPAPEKM